LRQKVRAAVDACPRGAIAIESAHSPAVQDRTGRTATK
jgi:hypothetical protein